MINTVLVSVVARGLAGIRADQERAKVPVGRLMSRLVAAMHLFVVVGREAHIIPGSPMNASTLRVVCPFHSRWCVCIRNIPACLYWTCVGETAQVAAFWWLAVVWFCTVLNLALVPSHGGRCRYYSVHQLRLRSLGMLHFTGHVSHLS